jgi:hypothetical protein
MCYYDAPLLSGMVDSVVTSTKPGFHFTFPGGRETTNPPHRFLGYSLTVFNSFLDRETLARKFLLTVSE